MFSRRIIDDSRSIIDDSRSINDTPRVARMTIVSAQSCGVILMAPEVSYTTAIFL